MLLFWINSCQSIAARWPPTHRNTTLAHPHPTLLLAPTPLAGMPTEPFHRWRGTNAAESSPAKNTLVLEQKLTVLSEGGLPSTPTRHSPTLPTARNNTLTLDKKLCGLLSQEANTFAAWWTKWEGGLNIRALLTCTHIHGHREMQCSHPAP